jgi:hypothetical protein
MQAVWDVQEVPRVNRTLVLSSGERISFHLSAGSADLENPTQADAGQRQGGVEVSQRADSMHVRRGMVYVRAKSPSGKWGSHDAMDLTDESFRVFVLDMLRRAGVLVIMFPEVDTPSFEYESKVELSDDA